MNKETLTLVAACIAAFTSIGNVLLSSYRAMALEQSKWEQARRDDAHKNLRLAVAGFAGELATAAQRTVWTLWIAANDPGKFDENTLGTYDSEMRAIFPKLIAAQVLVAANDRATHDRIATLSREFFAIDNEVSTAARRFRESRDEGLLDLSDCHKRAQHYLGALPDRFAELMPDARNEKL